MGNSIAILNKLARNLQILGLTIASQSQTAVVVSNGSNNLTISYDAPTFTPAVIGGVDPSVSPYLGIGAANPGQIQITSAISTNSSIADVIDGAVAAQVFASCASMANDIILQNANASFSARVRGHSDMLNVGQ